MKILRIIARLNVGGPARHVVWLTDGLRANGYDTMLVTGVVPPGEDDMTYFAQSAGVTPHVIPQMSREISLRDALAVDPDNKYATDLLATVETALKG